jgi:hypothetical protein
MSMHSICRKSTRSPNTLARPSKLTSSSQCIGSLLALRRCGCPSRCDLCMFRVESGERTRHAAIM